MTCKLCGEGETTRGQGNRSKEDCFINRGNKNKLCMKTVTWCENTLVDGKQRSGAWKRKGISFLNDVISMFFLLPPATFNIQQSVLYHVPYSAKGPFLI